MPLRLAEAFSSEVETGSREENASNTRIASIPIRSEPRFQNQEQRQTGGFSPMRSIAFADFLIGLGILFVLEGLLFAASPAWMRRAMKSALETPDNILRVVGIGSAVVGLILIWFVRR
jgi:uncharacterized protein YjeT (DUF2065 family)